MKPVLILFIFTLPLLSFHRPQLPQGERVIFSFRLQHSMKTVSISTENSGKYLVYRFGRPDSTELQYPDRLDGSSWKAFVYFDYHRGGGPGNLGMDLDTLRFTRNGITYAVYQAYEAEASEKFTLAIAVTRNGKTITLKGDPKSQYGTLNDDSLQAHFPSSLDQ